MPTNEELVKKMIVCDELSEAEYFIQGYRQAEIDIKDGKK